MLSSFGNGDVDPVLLCCPRASCDDGIDTAVHVRVVGIPLMLDSCPKSSVERVQRTDM
jgi:hypothetical protein